MIAAAAIAIGLMFLAREAAGFGAEGLRCRAVETLRWAGIRAAVGRLGLPAARCGPGEMGMVLEVAFRAPCCGLGKVTGADCGCWRKVMGGLVEAVSGTGSWRGGCSGRRGASRRSNNSLAAPALRLSLIHI